jgi:hypothetical protein
MGMRNLFTFLDGKPELKRPLGRSRRRRQGNIQNEFGEIDFRVVDCEISSSHGGEYDVQSCLLGCTHL